METKTAVVPFEEKVALAKAIAQSQLFGIKTESQALVLMALCEADGLHPIAAVRDFDIIQGRPAKKAEAMQRSFQASGGKIEWHTMTDEKADATFSHPQGGSVRIDWDMARAKKAGLGGKDNYSKFPRQMLAARVISEGCRKVWPAATSGIYTPEETRQFLKEGPERIEKDVTPPKVDTATGEITNRPPLDLTGEPTLADRIMACETADEVNALAAEVSAMPAGKDRAYLVKLGKTKLEEIALAAPTYSDAVAGIAAMQDDRP